MTQRDRETERQRESTVGCGGCGWRGAGDKDGRGSGKRTVRIVLAIEAFLTGLRFFVSQADWKTRLQLFLFYNLPRVAVVSFSNSPCLDEVSGRDIERHACAKSSWREQETVYGSMVEKAGKEKENPVQMGYGDGWAASGWW